ncbi:hypothetical protein ES319_A11G316600v1 [Gossypium barbadense]|uniref:Uncharacterized protein n=2 Tax=Gossypium TaxID=3633 RepID=A0A5J5TX87_GOSBA|nr:hypothetical protein ES319_A11G316600v1 [Gossypium barbadense]TYG96372.1 hypothetical protein ES288_A11G344900v1 [Gossypium darwinii]TYG96373.1 hypothetical protein ES288_A11G344900v1 [Gossypium darwinii]
MPITSLFCFHSRLKQRFLGISILFPLHRLAIHEEPYSTLTKISPQKQSQSAAISRTLRLRHSSPSSKSLEEVEYLDVLVLTKTGKKIGVSKPRVGEAPFPQIPAKFLRINCELVLTYIRCHWERCSNCR